MVRVTGHGDILLVPNPAKAGQVTRMQNIVFTEDGRGGANKGLSDSSAALDKALGLSSDDSSGLIGTRTHTQPVTMDKVRDLPLGTELNLYINRKLFSTPQMANQTDKDARMIDGHPTYFTTTLDESPKEDEDCRLDRNVIANLRPDLYANAQPGAVRRVHADADGTHSRELGPNQPSIPRSEVHIASVQDGNREGGERGQLTSNQEIGAEQQGATGVGPDVARR